MKIKSFWRYYLAFAGTLAAALAVDTVTARDERATLTVEKCTSTYPESGDALTAAVFPGYAAPEIVREISGRTERGEDVTLKASANYMATVKAGDRIPVRIHHGGFFRVRSIVQF